MISCRFIMSLTEKLSTIALPRLRPLGSGEIQTMEEYWNTFVEPFLPDDDVMERWHRVLMEYIASPNATFALRAYFSASKKEQYHSLRRGFLTHTNEGYSFFFTDNFFAAYFHKMVIDGFVPTCSELINEFRLYRFPARFGRNTREERELMALKQGPNPGFAVSGYKISHIVDVGGEYVTKSCGSCSFGDILARFVPRGERDDWKITSNLNDKEYYERYLVMEPLARELIAAHFLRFVHPFNAFLSPKKKRHICLIRAYRNDIGEDKGLREYIQQRYMGKYGSLYSEFRTKALFPSIDLRSSRVQNVIHIRYSSADISSESESDLPQKTSSHYVNEQIDTGCSRALSRLECVYGKKEAKHHTAIQRAINEGCTNKRPILINTILDAFVTINTINSMCTEVGNSYGKYFHRCGRGGDAQICFVEEIWQKLLDIGWVTD